MFVLFRTKITIACVGPLQEFPDIYVVLSCLAFRWGLCWACVGLVVSKAKRPNNWVRLHPITPPPVTVDPGLFLFSARGKGVSLQVYWLSYI